MRLYKTLLLGASLLLPSGCDTLDDLGRHMPVIGERCESWQCFTEEGKAESDAKKRALAAREGNGPQRVPLNGTPENAPAPAQPATPPQEPTPYDMSPEQLKQQD